MIFDESTLRKLNQLTLIAGRVRVGILKGERRSTKRGTSIEFADYRNYTSGDDLRRLDWNVYARLDRPFIKLLEEEEDLAVHILIDTSLSMDWGEQELNKLRFSLRLGAALGAIALSSGDQLTVSLLQNGTISSQFGPIRSPQQIVRLLGFLGDQSAAEKTDLTQSLRKYSFGIHRAGLAFLISDFFSPGGHQVGINQLMGQGYEMALLHILSPDELEPPLAGDLRLVDIETGQEQEISMDADMNNLYRSTLRSWQEEISRDCQKRGIRYMHLSTAVAWDKVILYEMRKANYLK